MSYEITYTKNGDYYIPNLVLPNRKSVKLGKYGRMKARYLKENKKAEYSIMLIDNTLNYEIIIIIEKGLQVIQIIIICFPKENPRTTTTVYCLFDNYFSVIEITLYFSSINTPPILRHTVSGIFTS